jgi:endonuclease YncB( thermonuclease family)
MQRFFDRCYSRVRREKPTPPVVVVDYKDTVSFVPNIQSGHVIKVYDGDTITIASKLPYADSPLYRFSVRLRGIDCPEIHGKTEDEKARALCARKEMERLVLQKQVVLKNIGTEKYGRLLADVYINDLHVNAHMLQKGLALPYTGKTKPSWPNECGSWTISS